MLRKLRRAAIYVLLGPRLTSITTRALMQGTDIWAECINDPAMQNHPDDIAVVEQVKVELDIVSQFWRL